MRHVSAFSSLVFSSFLGLSLTALTACTERPQDGLDALLLAMQQEDADAAWQRFDRSSRAMLDAMSDQMRLDGKLSGSAKEHLTGGFLPKGTDRIELLQRDGDRATLKIVDLDGKTKQIEMRLEENLWRLHLEGSD